MGHHYNLKGRCHVVSMTVPSWPPNKTNKRISKQTVVLTQCDLILCFQDLEEEREISKDEVIEYSNSVVTPYIETSAKVCAAS